MTSPPVTELVGRIDALQAAVRLGADLLPPPALEHAAEVVRRAGSRIRHGTRFTVVALAGATGSGKSSLFNALVGADVSPVGVMRPTTDHARAAIFGDEAPAELLTWLGVRRRHGVASAELEGLVLLDLPDHDSVVADHRLEVDRLVGLVDVMVWVLDPQKYADEAVHRRYLSPLAGHADSMVFVLNHVDEVPPHERERWGRHAAAVLLGDGIADPQLLMTSAITGEGVAELRAMLRKRIETREAALARLDADLRRAARQLGPAPAAPTHAGDRAGRELAVQLGEAAGSDVIADAVDAGYRYDAARETGWPFARWVLRFRRHPLRALRPTPPARGRDSPAPPTAIPVDRPRIDLALRSYADARTDDMDPNWMRRARTAAGSKAELLPAALGAAVRAVSRSAVVPPRWWRWVGGLQRVLAIAAAAGAMWLLVLAVLGYLMVPSEDLTPHVGSWPVPTLLLLGGGTAGLVAAWIARIAAAAGARRRAHRATAIMLDRLDKIVQDYVAAPLDVEFARWERLRTNLAVAAGERRPDLRR